MGRPAARGLLHAGGEAGQHRLGDRLQAEAVLGVELRGEADLGIDDPVVGQVLDALAGDTLERLRRLHHGDRVLEAFEVADQVPAWRLGHEPAAELVWVLGREVLVADGVRQLHDRRRPEPAVEMVVEEHLGGAADLFEAGCGIVIALRYQPRHARDRRPFSLVHHASQLHPPHSGASANPFDHERGRAGGWPPWLPRARRGAPPSRAPGGPASSVCSSRSGWPLYRLSRLDQAAHPGAGAHRVFLSGSARPQAPGGDADGAGFQAAEKPVALGQHGLDHRAAGSGASGSPPWARTISRQTARAEPSWRAPSGSPASPASSSITSPGPP